MSDFTNFSRVDKFEKRRKNTKSLSILLVLGGLLLVIFIGMMLFGGNDNAEKPEVEQGGQAAEENSRNGDNNDGATVDDKEEDESQGDITEEENGTADSESGIEAENEDEMETEQVEPSDDNVVEAYTKDWQPIGTEQTGPHTINLDEGSQDRQEMRQAAALATGLNADSLIMWWIDQNGEQTVVNTVSNAENTEYYRVYLTWVDDQGWKPTKVEVLKENDQQWRFE